MDKYEYREKTEQMLAFAEKKQYGEAMEIADMIDWKRVKSVLMLSSVSEIYERNGEYKKSREVLKYAYDRQPGSRKLAYRLGSLALKDQDIQAASDYYEEFVQIAPKDPNQYILKYKILKSQNGDIKEQIAALEEFKEAEYIEKWAYELATLYHEAGMTAECLEECDDLMLWFSDGKYVYKAMELKMQYKPLTPIQQEKYDNRPGAQARRLAAEKAEAQEKAKAKAAEAARLAAERKAAKEAEAVEEEPVTEEPVVVEEPVAEEPVVVEEAAVEEELTAEEKAEDELADSIVALLQDEIEEAEAEKSVVVEEPAVAEEPAVEEPAVEEPAEEEKAAVLDEKTRRIPDDVVRMMNELENDITEEEDTKAAPITEQGILDVVGTTEEVEMQLEEVEFEEAELEEEDFEEADFEEAVAEEDFAEESDDEFAELKMSDEAVPVEESELSEGELKEAVLVAEEASEEDFEEEDFEEEDFEEADFEEADFEEEELSPEEAMENIDKALAALEIEEPTEAEIQRRLKKSGTGKVPFDTGFVVTGRYDLSATSEIGLKAGLTEDQKKLFSYFVPVRGMSEQLVEVLDNDKRAQREGTSKTGNLMVVGRKGSGKTVLAVDIVKAIQKQRDLKQGKMAIISGESLSKKDMSMIFQKLHGGALIIENAGSLSKKTVVDMNLLMERKTGELLIVLEDQKKPMERLMAANPEFKKKFTSRLELPVFINDELVTFGQTYAKENGCKLDEMGILALYSRIDMMQREDHQVSVAEVKDIVDEAIEHSKKANVKHLARRMFGKRKDEKNRIILSEEDFKV